MHICIFLFKLVNGEHKTYGFLLLLVNGNEHHYGEQDQMIRGR